MGAETSFFVPGELDWEVIIKDPLDAKDAFGGSCVASPVDFCLSSSPNAFVAVGVAPKADGTLLNAANPPLSTLVVDGTD